MIAIHSDLFVRSMNAARKALAQKVIDAVKKAAQRTVELVKLTKFKHPTGNLKGNTAFKMSGKYSAKVTANVKHAAWVEYGNNFRTGEAWIKPKHAKFLRFTLDGTTYFMKRVKASKPTHFMQKASDKATPLFERLCVDAVNRMFG
jgi:hypothetical protein